MLLHNPHFVCSIKYYLLEHDIDRQVDFFKKDNNGNSLNILSVEHYRRCPASMAEQYIRISYRDHSLFCDLSFGACGIS